MMNPLPEPRRVPSSARSVRPIERDPARDRAAAPAVLVGAGGGRVDVDDGGIDLLDHVRKIDESRWTG